MSDRFHELGERRDFLLRSIDDLEREHEAGDLIEADFDLLHRDYSRRAAEVLREIENGAAPVTARIAPTPVQAAIARKARMLRVAAAVGIVAFAGASGLFVAKTFGVRSGNSGLTGSVNAAQPNTTDAKVEALLRIGRENLAKDPLVAIQSFDAAVALDPTQVEAMTYAGWVLRLASQSVTGDAKRKELLDSAVKRIDKAIDVDPNYPDARAFRGIIRLRDLDDPKGALEDFATLDTMTIPDEVSALIGSARTDAEAAMKGK